MTGTHGASIPLSHPPVSTGAGHGTVHPQESVAEESSTEQVLLASFKAAALSVTQLYKDSLKHQRAEHAKGYEAALQDL
ncbi:hypothetical protein BGZ54_002237, partial [Gamsiella multidivaricata]